MTSLGTKKVQITDALLEGGNNNLNDSLASSKKYSNVSFSIL